MKHNTLWDKVYSLPYDTLPGDEACTGLHAVCKAYIEHFGYPPYPTTSESTAERKFTAKQRPIPDPSVDRYR